MIATLRNARRLRGLLLLPVLLSGCAAVRPVAVPTTPDASRSMNAAMASWKGRRVYEAVAMWGMPDSITREGTLGLLRWKADARAIGSKRWGEPFSGEGADDAERRQDWPMRCARVLTVDVEEVVQQATWSSSAGCSVDPTDYLPPP